MVLKTKAGITRKQKIAEHKKSGCLFAKIVQYLMALKTKTGITSMQKKADHQKSGYLSVS
jgi:hypothetical protein